ncbi:MAG: hypothetical protein KF744_11225 [Taibaiella sp.]|nr:hypothetical protein [Taibaiella sp.]
MHHFAKPILLCLFLTVTVTACSNETKPETTKADAVLPDYDVARQFMDEYINYPPNPARHISDSAFISSSTMLTSRFKSYYDSIVVDAWKRDPELGLDFDPVLDAQDYPDSGFMIERIDTISGIVTLSGKNWPEFTVAVKVIAADQKTLIDGAGVVNISEEKRATR